MELLKTAGQEVIVSICRFWMILIERWKMAKTDDKEVFKVFELINWKWNETLKSKGLEILEVRAGECFDAEIHEAITRYCSTIKMKGKL